MKHIRICFCLVLALLMALAPAAMANQLPVPSPTQAPASGSGGGLPVPGNVQPKVAPLPHPGSFFGEEGELALTGYEYDGAVWDVWYIPMGNDWGEQLTGWLKACREAGYTWKPGTTDGNTSYEVTDGEKRALLLPDYYGQIMFMKQDGIEMDEFAAPAEKELQPGQIHLFYGGRDYGFYDINLRTASLSQAPIHKIYFEIPSYMVTGDRIRITKDTIDTADGAVLQIDDMDYLFHAFAGHNKLISEDDYCEIYLIYRDDDMVRGTFEGRFEDGAVQIAFEFYLPFRG